MKQHTKIDDIAQVGEELAEDEMRLAAGGEKCYTVVTYCGREIDNIRSNDVY